MHRPPRPFGRRFACVLGLAVLSAVACSGCAAAPGAPTATSVPATPPVAVSAAPAAPTATAPVAAASPAAGLYDATGARIDVGGYRLVMRCAGQGRPVVLLDAGGASTLAVWDAVQPAVAQFSTVCAYNRAGLGGSDPRPATLHPTSGQMVTELRALLGAAGIARPVVLVGHSLGGLNALLYARTYPDDVSGLALVDARPPDFTAREQAALSPAQQAALIRSFAGNAEGFSYADVTASSDETRAAPPLRADLPLRVLSHGQADALQPNPPAADRAALAERERAWQELQAALARESTRGKLVPAAQSGHNIHLDQPQLVITAIRELVDAARGR
jgi:pimeloyl-ACP methyl ester carboxylesterase